MPTTVFINEFHYDNASTDTGEFIEVAGPAGTDLAGWSIVLYNGTGGAPYATLTLSGIIADQQNGFGTVSVAAPGLQNGSPDGFALVDATGAVRQFLSYEGSFAAVGGPADGLTSTAIPVSQSGSEPAGSSLHLIGTGSVYEDFTWSATTANTAAAVNSGQTFGDEPPPPPFTAIAVIQGAGHASALVGQTVLTSGIVTAVDSNGFYLQDPTGDGDDATSEAVFVFTSSAPAVAVGDEVQVQGTVSEFLPRGDATNLTITQIVSPTITLVDSGNELPAAIVLGDGGRTPPTEVIDDDGFAVFDPATDGIDFYESLEGMRVTIPDAVSVSVTNRFGELFTVADEGAGATGFSQRGTVNIAEGDFNPERIQIQSDSGIGFSVPEVGVGAALGDVTGVVSYAFGNFEVLPTAAVVVEEASSLVAETTTVTPLIERMTVATYNVENLDPNDADGDSDVADGRFEAIARHIVFNLGLPDVLSLEEIQDDDGSLNSAVSGAGATLQLLADEIFRLSGVHYDFLDNPFVADDRNGGQPGGNIRVAFLYNPERVDFVPGSVRPVTDPATQQDAITGNNPFDDSRPPLAAGFAFNGELVTVVGNHWASKTGSLPLFGSTQPSVVPGSPDQGQENPLINRSLDQRREQAAEVVRFVDELTAADPDGEVVVLGDLNEFEFISAVRTLEASLFNLTGNLPEDERYTFVFDGNSQSLDHILVTPTLATTAAIDVVHVNSEFTVEDGRASDHDPAVAGLGLQFDGSVLVNVRGAATITTSGGNEFVLAGDGDDRVFTLGGNDRVDGGDGNDFVVGGTGRDRIAGNAGADDLRGGDGDDVLVGGDGDDNLESQGGNDLLDGGDGDDRIATGRGFDLLVLRPDAGTDTILDFRNGADKFLLVNSLSFADLLISVVGTTTEIAADGDRLAVLLNVTSGIGTEDFLTPTDAWSPGGLLV